MLSQAEGPSPALSPAKAAAEFALGDVAPRICFEQRADATTGFGPANQAKEHEST